MTKYYLAIDIGASSGRHILGYLDNGKIVIEEIYRFKNEIIKNSNGYVWDTKYLFDQILVGLKRCVQINKMPSYMGIDTWGVDFVLLDKDDKILGDAFSYRDNRTKKMDTLVYEKISLDELYKKTGIQKMIFNTIYQLMALKIKTPKYLEEAKSLLMIPDYFNYLLTGVKKSEYTNATTTQLVNAKTCNWDDEIIETLGFKREIFQELANPGNFVGDFSKEIQKIVGFNCKVILPATHDTASAVVAVPTNSSDAIYLSSGTWSLMGIETKEAICSKKSMDYNFTNEGGYNKRFRYLKNIMGLWMIQSLKKELDDKYSFEELCQAAEKETIASILDCKDTSFLAPDSMIRAVKDFCKKSSQPIPNTPGELAAVIYNSLAQCYANTANQIEILTNKTFNNIFIIGGGANVKYLNELTAKKTKKNVYAGPIEATAIGNILVQMLNTGVFNNLKEARKCVLESFGILKYIRGDKND